MDQSEPLRVSTSNRILTIPEAIAVLRIGKSSFFKLIAQGTIRTLRLGGRTLVPEREIERLIASATAGTVEPEPPVETRPRSGGKRRANPVKDVTSPARPMSPPADKIERC